MPRVSHLIRRNGVYWFKIDLPDQLAGQPIPASTPDILKCLESPMRRGHLKTAIWLSLRTTVEREARQRVGLALARHARLFDAARALLVNDCPPSEQDGLLSDPDAVASITPPFANVLLPVRPAQPVGSVTNSATADHWIIP